jgi:ribosomal protein S16
MYDPNHNPALVSLKKDSAGKNLVDQWLARGAKPTETVHSLLRRG